MGPLPGAHNPNKFWKVELFERQSTEKRQEMAGVTRLELAASGVTGRRSNQTELHPQINPCFTPDDSHCQRPAIPNLAGEANTKLGGR